MISFNTVVVSFQSIFQAFNGHAVCQCRYIEKEFSVPFFVVRQHVWCKIKLFSTFLRFKKLAIKTILNVCINLLWTVFVVPLYRRERVNSEFCFSVFAYPAVEFFFENLETNSSKFIFPLNFGICFRLKFLKTFPYFLTQLYAVAGQIFALSYSRKCLLTSW